MLGLHPTNLHNYTDIQQMHGTGKSAHISDVGHPIWVILLHGFTVIQSWFFTERHAVRQLSNSIGFTWIAYEIKMDDSDANL